jgi:transmembrane sensor
MNTTDIDALLDKYKKGETTPEETALVEHWLKNPNSQSSDWAKMDEAGQELWLNSQFARIASTVGHQEARVIPLTQRRKWRPLWAAAAAILIIGLSVGLYPLIRKAVLPGQLISLSVPGNGKKAITLADGSFVNVNAGSQLRYPKTFNGKTREVYLSGEAYFDIHHETGRPFIIHTGKVITTVLGTAFNIKEDKLTHAVTVTVTRGKVSVSNGSRLLGVLTPNQQIRFNAANNQAIQQTVDAQQAIAWQKIDLKFEDITLADAAKQLEQHFHVKITFSNEKIKDCRFTGSTLNGEKLEQVLSAICSFNQATYQKKTDGSIVIDGPGCN